MDENRFWILASKKVAGDISEAETTELELLFVQNPDFRNIINSLAISGNKRPPLSPETEERLLKDLRSRISANEPPAESTITGYTQPADEAPIAEPGFWASYTKRIALSSLLLILVIGATFFLIKRNGISNDKLPVISENNIATKPGSRSQVKLPDGTVVMLNADSRLSYPDNFLGDTREVTLEGEAFFEVKENKSKPFIIHLKSMDIKVLGTVFNVKAYPGERAAEASLIKGSIEITLKNRKNEKIMLKANEKISVMSRPEAVAEDGSANLISYREKQQNEASQPLIAVDRLDTDETEHIIKEIGWTQNKIMFRNEDLQSIATTLERWYGREVEVRSDKLKGQKFTGNFSNESLLQIVQALQVSYNFNFKKEGRSIIIY